MGSSAQDLRSNGKRRARKAPGRSTNPVNWNEVDREIILRVITAATRAGGAVRFGGTRDNGALALGVYGDGDPYTEYFRDGDDCATFIEDLTNVFTGIADSRE